MPPTPTAQDQWLAHPSIGVHASKYPTPAGPGAQDAPPAAAQAGSDKQSQEFQAAFNTQYNAINTHLAYTAINADPTLHDPLASKRNALAPAYQAALGKVDADDPKKAKPVIDKVLASAKALNAEVSKFRAAAEKAFNDWQSHHENFDTADSQLQDLEAWEEPKAVALRASEDGIATLVGARKYAEACTTLDKLLPKLKPVYDEYLKQKAAKELYDTAMVGLKPKLDAAQVSSYVKLQPLQKTVEQLQGQMIGAVAPKNYVLALKLNGDVSPKVDQFLAKKQDMDDQKKEYEVVVDQMDAKNPGPVIIPKKLAPMETTLAGIRKQMEAAAESESFDQALKFARDLSLKYDLYLEDLKRELKKRADYNDALTKIEPRLPKDSPQNPKLTPLAAELEKIREQMEENAKEEEYDKALQIANDLSVKLDAYEAAVEQIKQQKEAYEKFLTPLKERLEKVAKAKGANQIVLQKEILAIKKNMEDLEAKGDYDAASTACLQLPAKLDAYDQATGAEKKHTIGGSFPFAKVVLAKFHASQYASCEISVEGSVKFGATKAPDAEEASPTNEQVEEELKTHVNELWKNEAELGWQNETENALNFEPGKVHLDVGIYAKSTEMGFLKVEFKPLSINLGGWDKKKGLTGPKLTSECSVTAPLKRTIKGIEVEGAIECKFAGEFEPEYLAIGKVVLERLGPEAVIAAAPVVGGIVGGIALCAGTMAVIDALEQQGRDAADMCQEGARRLRDYAESYGSAIRGKPGNNAYGNQDAESYLAWIMKTVPGTTHDDAIEMCKESDQKYEQLAYAKLLPQMREDIRKAYVKKHNITGENSNFRICLNEFLGDSTHY